MPVISLPRGSGQPAAIKAFQLKLILLSILIFLGITCSAQGIPPLQNFAPSDYGAENQNWDISQDSDKIIYIANSQGLLEYNGAHWSLYPLPNESMVRSVRVFDDRIYTGGFREFGFWERNSTGRLEYTSLVRKIRDKILPDEEFWNILKLDRLMVFHSLNRVYTYDLDDQTVSWVETDSSLPGIFAIGQTIFFQRPGEGLYSIERGEASLKYNTQVFREDEVVNMFELDKVVLAITRQSGIYAIRGETVEPWRSEVNRELSGRSVYTAIALRDGGFALGSISEGLVLLDREGRMQYKIDQSKGLQNNTVLSLFEDRDGSLWLGLDNGLSFLNLRSPYRVYQDYSGIIGSVYATAEHGDFLYMGTNQGLYCKDLRTDQSFELVKGTDGQVWSLDEIEDTLFCGHHAGTFIIEGNMAKKIAPVPGTWGVTSLAGKSGLALQGNYSGLYVLERTGESWNIRNKISGFDISSRYFEILKEEIFVNHEYKGVFRIKTDSDFNRALKVQVDTIHRGANSGLARYEEDLLFCFREGIYKFDAEADDFIRDSILSSPLINGGYVSGKMIPGVAGESLWIFTEDHFSVITPGTLDARPNIKCIPLGLNQRRGINGYESIYGPDQRGHFFLGTNNGFLTFRLEEIVENRFKVGLQKIQMETNTSRNRSRTTINLTSKGDFKNRENNLEFRFYSPVYEALYRPSFQYRLRGIYEEWSDWTEESAVSFSNLPFGNYVFEVRGKLGNDLSENTPSYSFTIARPWYLTGVAMVSYLLILTLGAIGIHRTYRRYYRTRQQEILDRNKQEIALAKAKNEKEIIDLKNRQLKEEFRNKSNELAASTMSLIKKNELLTRVKEQLLISEKQGGTSVKQIVRIIDKSIDQNDDWEMFLEAFNNADQQFLTKLNKKHPNLSPNDIKLCAYLRLNLSSKEIAPLLNISTRSVEIKRYRLRKKMNLEHDENLTEYILTL